MWTWHTTWESQNFVTCGKTATAVALHTHSSVRAHTHTYLLHFWRMTNPHKYHVLNDLPCSDVMLRNYYAHTLTYTTENSVSALINHSYYCYWVELNPVSYMLKPNYSIIFCTASRQDHLTVSLESRLPLVGVAATESAEKWREWKQIATERHHSFTVCTWKLLCTAGMSTAWVYHNATQPVHTHNWECTLTDYH